MILLFLTFIPLLLIDIFMPHVLRKTTVFGISIPEPFTEDDQLTLFKRKYSLLIAGIQTPVIAVLVFMSRSLNDMQQSLVMVGGLFLYLVISMVIYLKLHKLVKNYKKQQGWDEQVTIVRVSSFETKFNKRESAFPHMLFIPVFLITIGLTVWLIFLYPKLPDIVPIHWGANGQPDAWSDKSFFSVFSMIFILFFTQGLVYILSYGAFNSSVQLKAQNTELSLQREHEMRKLTTVFMALVNVASTLFLGMLLVQSTWSMVYSDSTLSMWYSLPIFLLLFFGGIYYYMKRSKELNEQFKDADSHESSPGDDEYWKWGIFYFNKDNPDLFIEKKFGVGWTMNFARPAVWIFLVLIIVVPLIPMFFI